MKKLFIFLSTMLAALILVLNINVKASTELDRILDYEIIVNPNDDATLNMEYHIKWKVLDSTTEGPLEWVKIGVPNRYVSDIKAKSTNIRDISYYSDGGAYIRCDFDKSYYKNEIVDFSFSFHQERIFSNSEDGIEFRFVPGWFPYSKVDHIKVMWNVKDVNYRYSNTTKTGDYLVWETSLDYNQKINCDVKYNQDFFPNIDLSKDYSDETSDPKDIIIFFSIFVGIFLIFVIIGFISSKKTQDSYLYHRGYSGDFRFHFWFYYVFNGGKTGVTKTGEKIAPPVTKSTGSGSSGSHSCACACACACAGGGRAGCSRKDFYSNAIEIDKLEEELKEHHI